MEGRSPWHNDGTADVVGHLRSETSVPAEATLDDPAGELLAVDRTQHIAAPLAVDEAVEPHMVDALFEVGVVEQGDRPADVILFDVCDDEDLVAVVGAAHQFGPNAVPRVECPRIDQQLARNGVAAVLHHQRV
jgi:hypothetical protein